MCAADEVSEERVGDGELVFIRGTRTSKSVSIVLRGANEFLLDEMDRALHDTLCVVQKVRGTACKACPFQGVELHLGFAGISAGGPNVM